MRYLASLPSATLSATRSLPCIEENKKMVPGGGASGRQKHSTRRGGRHHQAAPSGTDKRLSNGPKNHKLTAAVLGDCVAKVLHAGAKTTDLPGVSPEAIEDAMRAILKEMGVTSRPPSASEKPSLSVSRSKSTPSSSTPGTVASVQLSETAGGAEDSISKRHAAVAREVEQLVARRLRRWKENSAEMEKISLSIRDLTREQGDASL